jgi:preprotein translocase subunit SecA
VAGITADVEAKKADVLAAGGLYVVGTERHESRRIDNQLRGRAGRQGDPGSSKFFLSLDDDLMRIFGSERMDGMLQKLGLEEGEAIIHPWINKALEKAQEKVEARNFEIRKQLLKYDDVMNDQRKVIYEQRKDIMRSDDVSATITDMRHQVIEDLVTRTIPAGTYVEQWNIETLRTDTQNVLGLDVPIEEWVREEGIADQEILERLTKASNRRMAEKVANYGRELMRMAEKSLLLQIVDQHWKEHLLALDHLRQGINLRAYAQRDPLNEYKREAFNLFEAMLGTLRQTVTGVLANIEVQAQATPEELETRMAADRLSQEMHEGRTDPALAMSDEERETLAASGGYDGRGHHPLLSNRAAAIVDPDNPDTWGKVARNSACPCGSSKKFKHCHGRIG